MVYCGNNLFKNPTREDYRYECFRKGVGVGLNKRLVDRGPYEPIEEPNDIHCGKESDPDGRDGSNLECLIKGVGVGIQRQLVAMAEANGGSSSSNKTTFEVIFFVVMLIVWLTLF
jgi:hypothetical protein